MCMQVCICCVILDRLRSFNPYGTLRLCYPYQEFMSLTYGYCPVVLFQTPFDYYFIILVLQLSLIKGYNNFIAGGPFAPLLGWWKDIVVFFHLSLALLLPFTISQVQPCWAWPGIFVLTGFVSWVPFMIASLYLANHECQLYQGFPRKNVSFFLELLVPFSLSPFFLSSNQYLISDVIFF